MANGLSIDFDRSTFGAQISYEICVPTAGALFKINWISEPNARE